MTSTDGRNPLYAYIYSVCLSVSPTVDTRLDGNEMKQGVVR